MEKEEMQILNKSDSFPAPEGLLGVWTHTAGLTDKVCKAQPQRR